LINVLALLAGCLAAAQGIDPQNSKPPLSSHLREADDWQPLDPEPFEGCDIIINHNVITGKLTIDAILSNSGYTSLISVVDSAVYVNINSIAKKAEARSIAMTFLPYIFDLFVMIDDCDTAQYKVIYMEDSLQIIKKRDSKYVRIRPIKQIPCSLCWLQFTGNQRSLIEDISYDIAGYSDIIILERGYYLNFPLEIYEKQDRRHSFNTTRLGTIIFLRSDNVSFPAIFDRLVKKYASRKLASQGCLQNIKKE